MADDWTKIKDQVNTANRAPRTSTTREAESRTQSWRPASKLPDPNPTEGVRYRWIRTSVLGQPDPSNVSMRFREGWVPVLKTEHPELAVITDYNTKFPDNVEIGGLLLCRLDEDEGKRRDAYHEQLAQNQLRSADRNWMREQADPRMPLLKPERSSVTTFGGGRKPS